MNSSSRRFHAGLWPLGTVLALAVSLIGAPAAADGPVTLIVGSAPAPAVPVIDWTDCGADFQCATAQVPLDYDRPTATRIGLALIKLPATDPAQKIGSLFVNPGGPGGSGVAVVRGIGESQPAELRSHYDIVGFDPRGIAGSTPLRCFDSNQEAAEIEAPFAFPVTADEQVIFEKADRGLSDACAANGGAILDHMSTANVARDLDLLRQAVGDTQLNYFGVSYGSYLGQTYANMFPQNVGAFVIDGVLDPVAWSTGRGTSAQTQPFSERIRSDAGADRTLQQFFLLCDRAGSNCAFSGNARARFDALAARLLTGPIQLGDEQGNLVITYQLLISLSIAAMYNTVGWPSFAGALSDVEAAASAADIRNSLAAVRAAIGAEPAPEPAPEPPEEYRQTEGFPGVACSDSDNPQDYAAWPLAAQQADAQYRYAGRFWTWRSSICQSWPGQDSDRYTGPWNSRTATPVLVIGNYFDPATRYQGAVTAARLLPNSRLLSYAGWGHTAYLQAGNQCVDDAVVHYLLTKEPPRRGTVCRPERSPFDPVTPEEQRARAAAPVPLPLLPDDIRRNLAG